MDEREQLLPQFFSAHEWIAGQATYSGRPVGNTPKFMPLDNSLNRDILHSVRFHCVLSRFVLDGEGTDEEESNMHFSFSTPKEIAQGMKRIWESKMGTPSLARIIQDVDLARFQRM